MDFDRDFGVNQVFVEDQYDRWRNNPAAVSPEWQQYFARLHGLPTAPLFQTSAWSQPVAPAPGNGNGNGHAVETPANGFDQALLRRTYCRTIGVEFMHGEDPAIKRWLQERMEGSGNEALLSREQKLRILARLTDAETLETFLHRKYIGKKRFSLEGAESLIPLL